MLKLSEVAQRLNCSLSNVYALVESGRIIATSTGAAGKGYRIAEEDLKMFIDSRRKGKAPQPWPETTKPIPKLRNIRLSRP
jgi:excisionase family DNA binding protein